MVTNFLTTFAIAMFIALLGWGNQIKEIRKEIKDIIKNFSNKVKVKKEQIDNVTDGSKNNYKFKDDGEELLNLLDTIGDIAKNDEGLQKLDLLSKITHIKDRISLLIEYKAKIYDFALELTLVLFLLSLISYILEIFISIFPIIKLVIFSLPLILIYWIYNIFNLFYKINDLEKKTEKYISIHLREIE